MTPTVKFIQDIMIDPKNPVSKIVYEEKQALFFIDIFVSSMKQDAADKIEDALQCSASRLQSFINNFCNKLTNDDTRHKKAYKLSQEADSKLHKLQEKARLLHNMILKENIEFLIGQIKENKFIIPEDLAEVQCGEDFDKDAIKLAVRKALSYLQEQ